MINNSTSRNSISVARILLILMLFSLFLLCGNAIAKQQWVLNKEENGIRIYLRNTPNSALKSFRGEMTAKRSLSALLSVIEDTKSFPKWLHNCRSAQTVKRVSDSQLTNYIVTNMPWPVLDRDALVSSVRTQDKSSKQVEIKLSSTPNFTPLVQGKVRIQTMNGYWLLTPINKNTTKVVYQMSVDPGGNIPKWVVNAMAVDLPFNSLHNLRKISNKEPYLSAKVHGIDELSQ